MRRFCVLGVVIVFGFISSAFTGVNSNRIIWSEGNVVDWMDYAGVPDYNDEFRDAVTASALNYKTRCHKDGSLTVEVTAQFLKDQSWVKEVARTDYHLGHERLHFDITEVYARKFRKEIDGRTFRCGDEPIIDEIGRRIMAEWRNAQVRYDEETLYSLDREDQKEWHKKVAKGMIQFQDYASAD